MTVWCQIPHVELKLIENNWICEVFKEIFQETNCLR